MALRKLPKGYSSDFRLPNKKPVGSVELDLSGLGRHTTFLSVMSQGNLADLRSGRKPTLTEGVGYRVGNGNMGVDFNLINARLEYDTPVLFDVAKPFSLLWVGQGVETTSNSTVAVLKTADSNGLWLKHSNNSSYQNLTFGGSLDGISTKKAVFSTPVNQVNTYLLTYNGKGDLNANFRIFINDEEGVISDGVNQGNNSNYTVIGNRAFSDASLRGWMGFIATFDADLSLFSKDLINSPYQILKPKQAPIYFTRDAGGGTPTLYPSFIPSAEEFYTASVENMLSVIEPNFITSQESVYNPEVSPQGVTILPDYIPSEEVVYNPTVTDLLQVLSPEFIPTEETVYSPEVERLLQLLYPSYIESEEATYNPTVTGGDSISIPLTDRRTWNAVAQYLRDLVFTGQDNDVIQKWFISEGYEGEYNENWNNYLADQGYTDGNLSDRYSAWRKQ